GELIVQGDMANGIGVALEMLKGRSLELESLEKTAVLYIWTEEDYLAVLNGAFDKLSASSERVCLSDIANEIGVSLVTLWRYPRVQEHLKKIAGISVWTEEDYLAVLNDAFDKLSASSERVYLSDIANEIGVSLSILWSHPRVAERLKE